MVKLGRILKNEYRDDAGAKRGRRNSTKKAAGDSTREIIIGIGESPAQDAPIAPSLREDLKLPSVLLDILQSQVQTHFHHLPMSEEDDRDPIEPTTTNPSGSSENPHHFALTRAAQMALRSLPTPVGGDGQTNKDSNSKDEQSTMELIDTIVKTSDDPALVDALQAMMVESQSQSNQHRETLALVAESLMEKKAAKVARERAAMAESRLQESLKKCAPDTVGDVVPFASADVPVGVAACVSSDAARLCKQESAISNINSHNTSNSGFFQRINKSLTATSQPGQSRTRIPFVSKSSKASKSARAKNKSSSKGMSKADKAANKAAEKLAKEAMLIAARAAEPDQEDGHKNKKIDADGKMSDRVDDTLAAKDLAAAKDVEEKQTNQKGGIDVEGRDDQEQINDERVDASDTVREPHQQQVIVPRRKNKYKHIANTEPQILLPQFSDTEDTGSNSSASLGEPGFTDDSGNETDSDSEDRERIDLVIDTPKIEYTIFELESKLSQSTCSSVPSVHSVSSGVSYHSEDHDEDINIDTADEASLTEGNETGESDDEESDSDEDDDILLFASFCHRPGSFENDENHDDKRGRKERKNRDDAIAEEMPSLLKCVSGYFVGGSDVDVEVRLDEKKRRMRRNRRCRIRRS